MSSSNASSIEVDAVAHAEYLLAKAHLQLDLKIFEDLFHQDYLIIQPGGKIETKAEVIASYETGTRHWDTAQVDQLDIRIYSETAIVVGRWRASGQHGDEHFDYSARFQSIWIKQDGRWQNLIYQSTEIEN